MSPEINSNEFAEINETQETAFIAKLEALRPLLADHGSYSQVTEAFLPDLPLGENKIGITHEDEHGDPVGSLGELAVTNLGGLLEIGDGIVISMDPTRYEDESKQAAFSIDGKIVIVQLNKSTTQNLKHAEDLTVSKEDTVKVIDRFATDEFEFWVEQRYSCYPDEGGGGYAQSVYRRKKETDAKWELLADPHFKNVIERIKENREETPEEIAKRESQSVENPSRFDQSRYRDIMEILEKVEESNRIEDIPEIDQRGGFTVVYE